MANTITPIVPKLLGRAQLALRQACWMPRLVNFDYSSDAAGHGDVINVPIPSALTATDVVPGPTPITASDSAPTTVPVPLNNWKHVGIVLTDKEMVDIDRDEAFMPMQLSEAMKALANAINIQIWSGYTFFYGYAGVAGTTPFATAAGLSEILEVRRQLNVQLCPRDQRRFVMDFAAEAQALALAPFRDASQSTDAGPIIEGSIGRKLGFDCYADDHTPTHVAGTGASYVVNNGPGYAAGIKTIVIGTGTGTLVVGDIITFAGHAQTYVITAGTAAPGSISFEPGLQVAVANAVAITKKATHVVNLAFNRNAFAFASRSLRSDLDKLLGAQIYNVSDPVTKISFRAELIRENKQWVWDFDVLWGSAPIRRELGCRLAG